VQRKSTALTSIGPFTDAGARLVTVEDNFDGSTPMGRFAIGILTLIAELPPRQRGAAASG
jgi:DNA invertase Pin-like site-specific DNA recombinase